MAKFDIAEQLGWSVRELDQRMDHDELVMWKARKRAKAYLRERAIEIANNRM